MKLLFVMLSLATITYLVEGITTKHKLTSSGKTIDIDKDHDFQIFCRDGDSKMLVYYFRTATLRIISSADDIKLIKGNSAEEVREKYLQSTKFLLWAANLLPWRARDANFPTFNSSCVGISTGKPYVAMLLIRPVDPWKFVLLALGIALFFLASKLAKSTLFFYTSGTFFGALAAALVFLFVVTRILPKGRTSYITLSALWMLCLYFAGETWNHFEELLHQKLPYILVYVTTGAIIAFVTCYRLGPPTHPKTLDLIKWALQIGGVALIHLSSDLIEVSTAIIVVILLFQWFGGWMRYNVEKYYRRLFPPKLKLLTEEEYIQQGAVETEKGLKDLRKFCSSPDCKSWKLVTKLKDPIRFSEFMEGNPHLSDDEMMSYESEHEDSRMRDEMYTDDDDDGRFPETSDESD